MKIHQEQLQRLKQKNAEKYWELPAIVPELPNPTLKALLDLFGITAMKLIGEKRKQLIDLSALTQIKMENKLDESNKLIAMLSGAIQLAKTAQMNVNK